jgi:hypothetical protein
VWPKSATGRRRLRRPTSRRRFENLKAPFVEDIDKPSWPGHRRAVIVAAVIGERTVGLTFRRRHRGRRRRRFATAKVIDDSLGRGHRRFVAAEVIDDSSRRRSSTIRRGGGHRRFVGSSADDEPSALTSRKPDLARTRRRR